MIISIFPEHTVQEQNFQSLQTSQKNAAGNTKPEARRMIVQS